MLKKLAARGFAMDKRQIYPSAERNKAPILDVLKSVIPRYLPQPQPQENTRLRALEVASGTGQHVAFFAPHFPHIEFQPSEFDAGLLDSVVAHSEGVANVRPPMQLDVQRPLGEWQTDWLAPGSLHLLLNVNMVHISPFPCAEGLFRSAERLLVPGGLLVMYGPFAFNGKLSPESNRRFDASLRAQCSDWGIRDVNVLQKLATGLRLVETVALPANNHALVWVRQQE